MKYIKSFENTDAMNSYIESAEDGIYLLRDESKEAGQRTVSKKVKNPKEMCLKALQDNSTIKLTTDKTTIQYSLDETETWNDYTSGLVITLNNGEKSYWRTSVTQTSQLVGRFIMTGKIAGSGNTNSLISTEFETNNDVLYSSCYYLLFFGCSSLTAAPELPATTLAGYCYYLLFLNCSSLTAAPELPATTPAGYCYKGMFFGCSSLQYIKCMLTSLSVDRTPVTDEWCAKSGSAQGVPYTGTFVKKTGVQWGSGYNYIPSGWTVIEADA